jgi:CubicO group peptidase (beta-lactamase class C family)
MRGALQRRTLSALAAIVTLVVLAPACSQRSDRNPSDYPTRNWEPASADELARWSSAELAIARDRIEKLPNASFMIIEGGHVVLEYGDLTAVTYLASIRKSVLAMLFGNYVAARTIDLDKNLLALDIDDVGGLTAEEKQATVRDLLSARSGVYHAASNPGDDLVDAPGRGTQRHGTYFLYNNWDFNVLGTIFEQETKQDIYDAFERDLARPLGMQDFERSLQVKYNDSSKSRHAAYHIYLSTRDMARIGYLMLRNGEWRGRQLVPRAWVREITRVVTPLHRMNPEKRRSGRFGYGLLWWVFDGKYATGPYEGAYMARGALGQHITVLPKLDMVIVHKTRPGTDTIPQPDVKYPAVTVDEYLELLDMIVRARCGSLTTCR